MRILNKQLHVIVFLIVGLTALDALAIEFQLQELHLEEAISQALQNNPKLAAEKEKLRIDRERLAQAKRPFQKNPELTLEANHRQRKFSSPSGKTGIDFELILLQEIEISGQGMHRISTADFRLKAAKWRVADNERRLRLQVKHLFYELLTLQEKMKVQEQRFLLHKDLFNVGRRRFEQEDISILEIDTLRFDRDQAHDDLKKIEEEKFEIEDEMRVLLALGKGDTLLALGELANLNSQNKGEGLAFETVENCALQHRPDLKVAQAALSAQEAALFLAKSRSTPNLSLGPLFKIDNEDQIIGASFNIPLPFFNRNQEEVTEAKVHFDITKKALASKKLEIERDVAAIYRHLNLAKERFELFEENYLEHITKRMTLPKRAYDAGEISIFEFSIAQTRLTEAHFRYLNTQLKLLTARADLDAQLVYCKIIIDK